MTWFLVLISFFDVVIISFGPAVCYIDVYRTQSDIMKFDADKVKVKRVYNEF